MPLILHPTTAPRPKTGVRRLLPMAGLVLIACASTRDQASPTTVAPVVSQRAPTADGTWNANGTWILALRDALQQGDSASSVEEIKAQLDEALSSSPDDISHRTTHILAASCDRHLGLEATENDVDAAIVAGFLVPDPGTSARLLDFLQQVEAFHGGIGRNNNHGSRSPDAPVLFQLAGDKFTTGGHSDHPPALASMTKHTGIEVPQGIVVADIASGVGSLSIELAKATGPDGAVFAVDIDPGVFAFLEHLVTQVPEGPRITPVRSVAENVGLADASLDLAIIHGDGFMSSGSSTPGECGAWIIPFLHSIHDALVPGAPLVVLSYAAAASLEQCGAKAGLEFESFEKIDGDAWNVAGAQDRGWLVLRRPVE